MSGALEFSEAPRSPYSSEVAVAQVGAESRRRRVAQSRLRIALEARKEQMVLPHAVDAQVFARKAFSPKSGLLQEADRGDIGRDTGGLDAMQPQRLECERNEAADRRRHVSAARVARADPIAEIAGLGATAPHIGERQAAHQRVVVLAKHEERIGEIAALVFGVTPDAA